MAAGQYTHAQAKRDMAAMWKYNMVECIGAAKAWLEELDTSSRKKKMAGRLIPVMAVRLGIQVDYHSAQQPSECLLRGCLP